MKTTEIFVEQVLIGAVVLAAVGLPFVPQQLALWNQTGAAKDFLTILVSLIGVAYLLGIISDRFADSLLARLERLNRIRFAVGKLKKKPEPAVDYFAEARLKIQIMSAGGPTADWMNYLRSRIRLTRALAVFLPALTVSAILLVDEKTDRSLTASLNAAAGNNDARYSVLAATAVFYLLAFFLRKVARPPPRTHAGEKVLNYWKRHCRPKKTPVYKEVVLDPVVIVLTLGAATGCIIWWLDASARDATPGTLTIATGAAGGMLTIAAGWCWWRITNTFMTFLRDCDKYRAARATP